MRRSERLLGKTWWQGGEDVPPYGNEPTVRTCQVIVHELIQSEARMLGAVSTSRLGCQFDRFLYASVGDDTNGMPLTVLSALARMDVDPWEEAAKLTQLPRSSAVTQLATLLGALQNAPVTGLDPARIATPLIALLPCPRDRAPLMLKAFAQAVPTRHPTAVSTVLTVLTYVISMLVVQWLLGSLQAPRKVQAPPTSASAIESPGAPISNEGPQGPIR